MKSGSKKGWDSISLCLMILLHLEFHFCVLFQFATAIWFAERPAFGCLYMSLGLLNFFPVIRRNTKLGLLKSWPLRLRGKSSTRFCMFPKVCSAERTEGNAPIYLNVYDLTSMNGFVYWAGIGIFHSGVEVHGVEYAFGAHDYPTSGVFEVEPHQCPGFRFRKSIFMGTTCLDPIQVREFMELNSVNYNGDTYHLIAKNCNHFCEDICYKLTGNSIPKWVNRLANIGSLCSCILPEAFQISAVRHEPDFQADDGEMMKLTSSFSCLTSVSMRQRQLAASSVFLSSPLKGCLQPWEFSRSGSVH